MASAQIRLLMIIPLLFAFTALPMAADSALFNPTTLYGYSFQAPGQGSVPRHFILETSMDFESHNIWGNSNGTKLKAFSPKGPGNSNPGLPGSLSGPKFGGFEPTDPDAVTHQDTVIQRISISEPGTLLLFGSGLLGITVWRRRRKRMRN